MSKTISLSELRQIKQSLPEGSTRRIADELKLSVDTVRNYFGAHTYKYGEAAGFHYEPGMESGIVVLDDTTILERALQILAEHAPKSVD
ncbi:MAG: DNA-binding protein [Bacteroidales bacterium]